MEDSRAAHRAEQELQTQRGEWQQQERGKSAPKREATGHEFYSDVDNASEASFPASDPPAWMGLPPGGPPQPNP